MVYFWPDLGAAELSPRDTQHYSKCVGHTFILDLRFGMMYVINSNMHRLRLACNTVEPDYKKVGYNKTLL